MSRSRKSTACTSRLITGAGGNGKTGARGGQLSHDMQQLLKRLLLTISKGEKSIERQRQKLAKCDRFEPYAAFMRVDRDENGVIGSVEVLRFLRENGVEEATEADCFLIVKYFDSDDDGYLNFQDFLQLLLPCDNQTLRAIVSQRPNYPVSRTDYLGAEIESDLTRLFEKEIAFNRVTEEMKQNMESNKQFDYAKAYQSIDDWSYGYIDRKNLKMFLKKHGYLASNEDVVAIIRRMDLDADARLTKQEFIEGIKPEEPYSKAMKRQSSRSRKRNGTPKFSCHSRKSSIVSRTRHGNHYGGPESKTSDMLILTDQQRDPIRIQALDRSINRINSSRSPLKSRPMLRELDQQLKFHTPKAGRSRFQSLPRTPNSTKGCYSAVNRSYSGGNRQYQSRRNFSKQKIVSSSHRRSRPSSSMGAYSISRMMKPGMMKSSTHQNTKNTYRQYREQLVSNKTEDRQGRTYNYGDMRHRQNDESSLSTGRRNEYEPVSRSFIEDTRAAQSDRSRVTKEAEELYTGRQRVDDEGQHSQLNSRRGPAGTSNFANESLSSTIQNNKQSANYIGTDYVQIHDQKSFNQKGYLNEQSPTERSAKSHYSILRKEVVLETPKNDFSQHTYVRSEQVSSNKAPGETREKRVIADAFIDFIQLEKDTDRLKVEITLREDYNLIDAFGLLDNQGKGYITPVELREALSELGLKCNIDEIHLVFEKFNFLSDGMLKYSEFSEAMMPQDQHYARLLGTKKLQFITKANRCPFDQSTLNKYMILWDMIIQNEKAAESVRQRLQKKYRFDIHNAFLLCDINRDDNITLSELRQFMFEMDCYVSSDDLQMLMNRFDRNRDGRISFKEFQSELTPKSPFNY